VELVGDYDATLIASGSMIDELNAGQPVVKCWPACMYLHNLQGRLHHINLGTNGPS